MALAAQRKLVKEIDITLKKTDEGFEEFNRYYEYVSTTTNPKDKDRYADELKKCINRQQRLRTQIREWLDKVNDPKEVRRLDEARKTIESDMLRFRDLERDLKTKAYSQMGLRNGTSQGPEDPEKQKYMKWLEETISDLQNQVESFDADIEASPKSSEELKEHRKRHKWHLGKLEQLLRAVINEAVDDMSELAFCKDGVDAYLEMFEDPDYYHDESLYDQFNLAEIDSDSGEGASPTNSASVSTPTLTPAEDPTLVTKKGAKGAKSTTKKGKETPVAKSPSVSALQSPAAKASSPYPSSPVVTPTAKGPPPTQSIAQQQQALVKASNGSLPPNHVPVVVPPPAKSPAARAVQALSEPQEVPKILEDQLLGEAEEFVCKICYVHVVSDNPVLTSCAHLFCGDCFQSWLKQHPESQSWAQRAKQGPDRTVPCPVCKHDLNVKTDLHPVANASSRSENLLLWRMLSSLKIMCSNNPKIRSDGECDWVGEYGTFEAHIKICQNKRLNSTCSPEEPKISLTNNVVQKLANASDSSDSKADKLEACASTTAGPTPDVSSPPSEETNSDASIDEHSPDRKGQKPVEHVPAPTQKPQAPTQAPQAYQDHAPKPAPKIAPKVKEPVVQAPKTAPVQAKTVQEEAPKKKQAQEEITVLTAVHPYTPEASSGMVAVNAGDRLEVYQRHESGWSFCRLLNKPQTPSGWVPNWVLPSEEEPKAVVEEKVVTPEPTPEPEPVKPEVVPPKEAPKEASKTMATVAIAFAATDSSQLTLAAEELVEIIQQHTTGWTYGRKTDGTEGWFPDWACAQ
eukprot:gnl/MRDRNA2_/MRDRNA2_91549_c0_seq1.p1 gnl/MRDRNA2_/MRDRNA2_91549_c0~~gnl/MRDRNA2_/MRDRNA2_91549_c0_seq1.p1  ORF type:complete len:799 (-),score=152.86 gnl/MRDRNA2_/MRDRNA2_91549_c0_seq1:739-3135(-)